MNVLLIAGDSKIRNIALMKISAYHKKLGDNVSFYVNNPDLIYVSILYSKNRYMVDSIKSLYPNITVIAGGPGYDPKILLPRDIEIMPPDNTIYHKPIKHSIGRITSGCPRKCSFCVVPIQESGGIRYIQPPQDFWEEGTILRVLDDNILAMPSAFWELINFSFTFKAKLHIEYLDIRLIDRDIARGLKSVIHQDNTIWFSYDIQSNRMDDIVREKVNLLFNEGFGNRAIRFFVYLHDLKSIDSAKKRWEVLRELGIDPFLMVNNDNLRLSRRLKRIARRGTRPAIFRGLSTDKVFE